ncbi:unnamed protein product, partial [Brassica oleracea var. botrytis]
MAHRYSRSEKGKWTEAPIPAKRPLLRISATDNNGLIAANKLTLIGRLTNPILQRTRAVIDFLPQVWNLEGRAEGRELGPEKFQIRTITTIGDDIGFMTDKVVDEAKFRVEVNGLQPLIMGMEIELPSEEVIAVEFEYIKIKKSDCPIRDRNAPHVKDRKLGITQRLALQRIEADKRRHDDRRGYKRPSTEVWYPSERYEDRPSRRHYSEH